MAKDLTPVFIHRCQSCNRVIIRIRNAWYELTQNGHTHVYVQMP